LSSAQWPRGRREAVMVRGALSWRRFGGLALAVLALHAPLLMGMHDVARTLAGPGYSRRG
jgi:hypothetical protein